eukprot:CAMPEP_0198443994 /NCGR_PEP_ID=MMETSP1452-20131203/70379_1 /TAXON_ID=1181717 /ORGANISM="Synchroma pusillum, Strain CCMP3072" /LENGTH=518 /DNA_ID=CAMNT_0044164645 /DNA_START=66 /DNA_END=1620 /DNA_ORIENTATION=-
MGCTPTKPRPGATLEAPVELPDPARMGASVEGEGRESEDTFSDAAGERLPVRGTAGVGGGKKLMRSATALRRDLESTSVVVVVRVRPPSREPRGDLCVRLLSDQAAEVVDEQGNPRQMSFDAVLQTTQAEVYARSGRLLVAKAVEGFNGTCLAYGQTGSGKTHTMMGTPEDAGVIPRLCHELFTRVSGTPSMTYGVVATYVEVYNDQIIDLLSPRDANAGRPAIREDPSRGIFLEGVANAPVANVDGVAEVLREGTARRTVGETKMNAASSRSHAILTLEISGRKVEDDLGVSTTTAKLHLVDLAGSERAHRTGASGDRLKEGAKINQSLSALGTVINALTSGGSRTHVPYRDSKLTRLLQDSLGGNSFTVIIACVGPGASDRSETLSTLRFASRAKKIRNQVHVNRNPLSERILALERENERLERRLGALTAALRQRGLSITELLGGAEGGPPGPAAGAPPPPPHPTEPTPREELDAGRRGSRVAPPAGGVAAGVGGGGATAGCRSIALRLRPARTG